MSKYMALALVRQDLSGIVEEVSSTHERVVVTRHGEPAAVLLSIDDLEALEETLEILADAALVAAIQKSLKATKRYTMTQARARLSKRPPA
ncbi:MAG: type II toxin-antitoxin system Phd/YefM family antitoxin [Actinomycetes bacterium]